MRNADVLHQALSAIANSSDNLLDDDELIEVLSKSKITAVQVNEKLTTAVDTDIRINAAREEYRPAARRGALLYFMVVDMASINKMYMVLLQQVLELHDLSVNHSEKAPIAAKRIINIMDYMTNYVTRYMHRGLFERPKKIWTLMLAMTIQQIAGTLSATYAGNLLKAGGALDAKSEKPVPAKWMPESVWLNCIALSRTVGMLRDLPDNLERFNDLCGRRGTITTRPRRGSSPTTTSGSTSSRRCLSCAPSAWTARCWPSTRTSPRRSAVTICSSIRSTLPRCTLRRARTSPMITILSMGSDPTGKILDLARKRKKRVEGISMGQGQEPPARKLLEVGITEGIWVMLQNCHLGLSFLGELTEWVKALPKLEDTSPGSVQPVLPPVDHRRAQPRLPHRAAAEISIKFTNEAPAGIMLGVRNTYTWLNQDMLDSVSDPKWKTMLFALAFMHTIVQERRKFGPLGFNILYEFSQADLSACVTYMQNHLNMMEAKRRPVDWITVNYMVCDVQYGGKITDDWDRRLFNTYGKSWLNVIALAISKYNLSMLVDLEAVGDSLLSLPIEVVGGSLFSLPLTAMCLAPGIKPSADALDYGDAFINHTYSLPLTNFNPSHLPAKFEVIDEAPMLKAIGEHEVTPHYGPIAAPRGRWTCCQLHRAPARPDVAAALRAHREPRGGGLPGGAQCYNHPSGRQVVLAQQPKLDWGKAFSTVVSNRRRLRGIAPPE